MIKTPCPKCGSEEAQCGYSEVENLKGLKTGFFLPFVHIERLGTVIIRSPLDGPELDAERIKPHPTGTDMPKPAESI